MHRALSGADAVHHTSDVVSNDSNRQSELRGAEGNNSEALGCLSQQKPGTPSRYVQSCKITKANT
jgi:hypothetical protein